MSRGATTSGKMRHGIDDTEDILNVRHAEESNDTQHTSGPRFPGAQVVTMKYKHADGVRCR